jgi:hypothetical protein
VIGDISIRQRGHFKTESSAAVAWAAAAPQCGQCWLPINIIAKQDGQAIVASLDSQYWHRGESEEIAAPQFGQLSFSACIGRIVTAFWPRSSSQKEKTGGSVAPEAHWKIAMGECEARGQYLKGLCLKSPRSKMFLVWFRGSSLCLTKTTIHEFTRLTNAFSKKWE